MSIGTPTWTQQVLGRPLFSQTNGTSVAWQRIPQITTTTTGFGFGQGGFGQGGFGGGQTQTGTALPTWTKWTTD